MPRSIPKGLSREHILAALADPNAGIEHLYPETQFGLLVCLFA